MRRWPWFALALLLVAGVAHAQLITGGAAAGGGSGTVQSVATTAPLSGGTIVTTGTLSCPTCVNASNAITSGQIVVGGTSPQVLSLATGAGYLKGNSGVLSFSSVSLANEVAGSLSINNLNASGTPSATTFLRGDGSWQVAGGSTSAAGSAGQVQYNGGSGAFTALASLTFTNANPNATLQIGSASLSNGRIQFTNTTNSNVFTLAQGATGSTYDGSVTASSFITNGTSNGSITLSGSSSGSAVVTVGAAAGTPTLTLPTLTGTFIIASGSLTSNQLVLGGSTPQVATLATGSGFLRAGSPPTYASVSLANEVSGTLPAANIVANVRARGLAFEIGDPAGASLSIANTTTSYLVVPFACTISAWNLATTAGNVSVKFWKVATGSAIPTSGNAITTSNLTINTGTASRSTTNGSEWSSTAVTANDIMAMNVTAGTATYVSGTLQCDQ